jgi:hypothetical protein
MASSMREGVLMQKVSNVRESIAKNDSAARRNEMKGGKKGPNVKVGETGGAGCARRRDSVVLHAAGAGSDRFP